MKGIITLPYWAFVGLVAAPAILVGVVYCALAIGFSLGYGFSANVIRWEKG